VYEQDSVLTRGDQTSLIEIKFARGNTTSVCVVLLDNQVTLGKLHIEQTNLTVGKCHDQEFTRVVELKLVESKFTIDSDSPQRTGRIEAAQVVEALVLTLGPNNKVVLGIVRLVVADLGDTLGFPIFLFLVFFVLKLTPQSSTSFLLFLFFIFLLILFHLELHHFHFPCAHRVVLNQVRIVGVKLCSVRSFDLVDITAFASDKNILRIFVPLNVIDPLASVQVQQADWSTLTQFKVAIRLKEKDLTTTTGSDEGHLVGCVQSKVDWAVMRFHDHSDLDVGVGQLENSKNTGFETTSDDATLVLLGAAHDIDTVSFSKELLAEVSLSTEEVPSLDHTILAASHCQVVGIGQGHVSNLTRVVLEDDLG
jgi:hypothetical protein